jgi:type II secretory pathway component PulJ
VTAARSTASPAPPRLGFTLVELLMATVIAVLLVAVVFSTYRTASLVRSAQVERRDQGHAAGAALAEAQKDLMRAFLPAGGSACAVALTQTVSGADLAFCMAEPLETEIDLRWDRIVRVHYRVDEGRLIRTSIPVAGPGSMDAPKTNMLAAGVDVFRVSLHDGADWRERWPVAETNGSPRAARIEIATRDRRSWATEIWIPAGTIFTSRIERTGGVETGPEI